MLNTVGQTIDLLSKLRTSVDDSRGVRWTRTVQVRRNANSHVHVDLAAFTIAHPRPLPTGVQLDAIPLCNTELVVSLQQSVLATFCVASFRHASCVIAVLFDYVYRLFTAAHGSLIALVRRVTIFAKIAAIAVSYAKTTFARTVDRHESTVQRVVRVRIRVRFSMRRAGQRRQSVRRVKESIGLALREGSIWFLHRQDAHVR